MKKPQSKKLIILILCVVMVLGMLPMASFAVEEDPAQDPAPLGVESPSDLELNPGADKPVGVTSPTDLEEPTPTPVEATPTPEITPTPVPVDVSALAGNDLYTYLCSLTEDELSNTIGQLSQSQIDSLTGIMTDEQAKEWFGIEPFIPLALGAGFVPFEALAVQSLDNEDLIMTKDSVYQASDDTVDITLTAYAKGVLTQIGKPADIVLVLDQSTSMGSMSGAFGTRYVYTNRNDWSDSNSWVLDANGSYYRAYRRDIQPGGGTTWQYYYNNGSEVIFSYPGTQLYSRSSQDIYRIHALIDAVTSFVAEVRSETTEEMDFRISLVGFNASAQYLTGSTASNTLLAATDSAIDTEINGLNSLANYTRQDLGLDLANDVFDTNIPDDRNRIVILFTDGEPYSGGGGVSNNDIIEDALTYARDLKNNKGVSVFTIGIGSTSLNPGTAPVEGATDQNTFLHSISSNYPVATFTSSTVTTYTRRTNSSSPTSGTYYIFQNYSGTAPTNPTGSPTPITYRNLSGNSNDGWYYGSDSVGWTRIYYTSSSTGQNMGSSTYNFWSSSSTTTSGIIPGVRNPSVDADGHLMQFFYTASDAEELNDVFLAVQQSLSGGLENITVKDFLMPQFEMGPDAITSISASIGSTPVDPALISYNPATRMLSVGPIRLPAVIMEGGAPKAGELAAKQLIITFTADVKEDFIGGNDVLTNDTGSGIYGSDGDPIEYYELPVVNVPLEYDLFDLKDQHVYLGDGALISDFFVTNNYEIDDNPFSYDGNNNGYVDIVYTVKNAQGTTIGSYTVEAGELTGDFAPGFSNTLINLTADTWYTITATIEPSEEGDVANGTIATPITSVDGDERADIFVYKPVVSTRNVAVHLTKNPTDTELTTNAITSVVWKHENDVAVAANMTQPTAPALDYTFDLLSSGYPVTDTTVNVTAIATMRGSTTTATLTEAGLTGRVSPFTLYVLKPTVDCEDSNMFLGDTPVTWSTYLGGFDKYWSAMPTGTILIGTAPAIDIVIDRSALNPAGSTDTGFTPVAAGSNDFNIAVKIGTEPVTAHSVVNNPVAGQTGHHFTITVVAGQLTITKSVSGAQNDECFLFTVTVTPATGASYTFQEVIEGNSFKVITGLPKGTYSVSEDQNWSWRYNTVTGPVWDNTQGNDQMLGESTTDTAIACTITNSGRTPFWLSDETLAANLFN